MTTLVNVPVTVGGKEFPLGGYTIFLVPSEKQWTLIISRSTDTSGKYDEPEDLVRVPMDSGELPSSENEFSICFTHLAPGQCSMRLDLEKFRAWVVFQRKN